jgi:hypothetical protein
MITELLIVKARTLTQPSETSSMFFQIPSNYSACFLHITMGENEKDSPETMKSGSYLHTDESSRGCDGYQRRKSRDIREKDMVNRNLPFQILSFLNLW